MASPPHLLERPALRLLARADALANRLYGWRGNPLYHSGSIAVALLLVLVATGIWLLIGYRIGAPYASVAQMTDDVWVGRWMRGVHRFASDAMLVATAIHAFRMFAQGRSWGPRVLAWASGVVMVGLVFVVGLTGYVMVWDSFAQEIAQQGARMLDSLPILSEPLGRAFAGDEELLGPFFFINLFAHIAIPLGLGLVLWLHVSRVARPVLLPPRRVSVAIGGALIAAALVWPVAMQGPATPLALPRTVEVDLFYGFWLPLVQRMPAGLALALAVGTFGAALLVPAVVRRRGAAAPPPSVVDEDVCTGCTQCSLDCPFDAITMIAREPGGRSELVAQVDPARCVSCGICAGSCAPMAVGPPGRTGREQLVDLRRRTSAGDVAPGALVVVCCGRSAVEWGHALEAEGATLHRVDCVGSVHTSVIELLVRSGAAGVLALSCPPRDCWNREGTRWLAARVYEDREAELQARVDRRRVRLADAGRLEEGRALAAFRAFRSDLAALDAPPRESAIVIETECVAEEAVP